MKTLNIFRGEILFSAAVALALAIPSFAAAAKYVIGSSNTVTADPRVPRPNEKPCVVQLFSMLAFEDFTPKTFPYAPPVDCPGPWQKVVFVANFSVSQGVQFDRTGNVFLGNTAIYFGTTAEPSPTMSPSWHVETDVTDYTPLFQSSQTGTVNLGNLVNEMYTGIIYGSAELQFYPLTSTPPQRHAFDAVLPLNSSPGTATLSSSSDTLSQTFTTLPMNIVRAYLDIYAQSQSSDEFWYTCVPDDVSSELQSCPGTAYREGEVSIDGQPAGVAPIFPWIYTGGIDPYLWFPLPGVQTLNFVPARVDLTPFAGLLSDGQPHTVSVSVFNADNYFSVASTLLLIEDKSVAEVAGAITSNNLSYAPSPVVTEDLHTDDQGNITGSVSVTSNRNYSISGYVETDKGRIDTTVAQNISFSNVQNFDITSTLYQQDITQSTTVNSTTTQVDAAGTKVVSGLTRYPLTVDINFVSNPDGTFSQTTGIHQENHVESTTTENGTQTYSSVRNNSVAPTDTLEFDANFNLIGNSGQSSQQHYFFYDSDGVCYDLTLTAANNVLTGVKNGCTK
jgi:hypothetical protein